MVRTICFDVLVLIKFLKPDRYYCEVTKPINNPDMTYQTFHWLKLVGPFITQKCLHSNTIYIGKRTLARHSINQLLLKIQVLRYSQKQMVPSCIDKTKVVSKRTIALALASHSLNQLLREFQALRCLQKSLECYIITSGCDLGDYVTFLRFLKQRRAWNLHNNLYLDTISCDLVG